MGRLLPVASACLTAVASLACATSGDLPLGRVVDLTWAFDASTLYWPTEERGFAMEFGPEGHTKEGYWYTANRFSTPEHGGTHIDAPIHFAENRWRVDEIPLRRLMGEGVVVDVREACDANPDYEITIHDVMTFEYRHGRIESGSIVILRTGFGERWPDAGQYLGTTARGPDAVRELSFPGLAEETARWLVLERRIRAVGIDTASIDPGQSREFLAHRALSESNIPAFENLAHLEELPPRDFYVVALPMKIRGGSGGPLRIIGIVR